MLKSPQRKEKHHAERMLHKLRDVVPRFFQSYTIDMGVKTNVVAKLSLSKTEAVRLQRV